MTDAKKPKFPDWIRAIRGQLTQAEFAREIGVARESVARWETAVAEPSYKHISAIAARFPEAGRVPGAPPLMELVQSDLSLMRSLRAEVGLGLPRKSAERARPDDEGAQLPGLERFLRDYDADLTPREKAVLRNSSLRYSPGPEPRYDNSFWWVIVKMVLRQGFGVGAYPIPVDEVHTPPPPVGGDGKDAAPVKPKSRGGS